MSIKSLSLFEMLRYIAQLSKQFRLRDMDFPITHIFGLFLQVYYHLGGLDRSVTNLAHVCSDFAAPIFCYHSRLFQQCPDLARSNRILDPKYIY